MTTVRLVSYVVDPYNEERRIVAALVSDGHGVRVVRASAVQLPEAARANVERVLLDLEATVDLSALPLGVGAQVVAGEIHTVPSGVADIPRWLHEALLARAA